MRKLIALEDDTVDNLSKDDRAQVWGMTFALDDGKSADGPLAAPPPLPPLAPPALWASEATGPARITIATIDAVIDSLTIWKISLCGSTGAVAAGSWQEQFPSTAIEPTSCAQEAA